MRALSARDLLDVWERGAAEPPFRRALRLLEAACPESSAETLALLSVGRRDARLLTLRQWTFGSCVGAQAACPRCGARLELTFDIADVQLPAGETDETFPVAVDEYELCCRLPDSADLEAAATAESRAAAGAELAKRCLQSVRHQARAEAIDCVPPSLVEAIAREVARRDPQADVELDLSCAECHHGWRAVFDIASYFWTELDAWARRLLLDVHALASAYGWSEAEIIAISPARRQMYLDMVSA